MWVARFSSADVLRGYVVLVHDEVISVPGIGVSSQEIRG
jgi:hypothetical protein